MDEPTRIMTLGKTAAPAVDEPTRVITLEKPAEPQPPAPEQPAEPVPQPVKERPPAAPAAAARAADSGGDRGTVLPLPAPLRQQGIRWRCSTTRMPLLPLRWNSSCPGASPSSAM